MTVKSAVMVLTEAIAVQLVLVVRTVAAGSMWPAVCGWQCGAGTAVLALRCWQCGAGTAVLAKRCWGSTLQRVQIAHRTLV